MDLKECIDFLKKGVKASTALDEFKHIDLTLYPAHEKEKARDCFMVVQKAIRDGDLSDDEFKKSVGIID